MDFGREKEVFPLVLIQVKSAAKRTVFGLKNKREKTFLPFKTQLFHIQVVRYTASENLDYLNAFQDLFRDHYVALCVRAFGYVHDHKVAEDIVQDVFLLLWERRQQIDFDRSIFPLLVVSVRNRSIDYLRRLKKRSCDERKAAAELDEYVRMLIICDISSDIELVQLRDEIHEGISQMPELSQRIFLLSRESGLKNREIADQLNISIKTVEKHITSVLAKLRLRLMRSDFFTFFFW